MTDRLSGDVTQLLAEWAGGDRAALDRLMPVVYEELRKIAGGYVHRERPNHTLQPTALVHEAWMRLVRQERPAFDHRRQFYGLAAQVMRRVLVDHARAAKADKRQAAAPLIDIQMQDDRTADLLALDQALDRLGRMNARQARVIELRYFGGLNVEEIADTLGVSAATISRDQKVAEAWLGHELGDGR